MAQTNRQWILRRRPIGDVSDDDLVLETGTVPKPGDGEIILRTRYLSMDPANRPWMNETPTYMDPVPLNGPMLGLVLGEVVASASKKFKVGAPAMGLGSWSDYCQVKAADFDAVPNLPGISEKDVFGIFMIVGPTAYFGIHDICTPKADETLVVSAAAGAVGSIAGQLGKARGARVVGIAGGAEKCRRVVEEFHMDAAIDYKSEDVAERLAVLCPNGIDCLFDNVGGPILDAVLGRINDFGRVAQCGTISMYNAQQPVPGPYNYANVVLRRIKIQGFIVLDHRERYPEAHQELVRLRKAGKLHWSVHEDEGLKNALTVFRKLYSGGNQGKLLLKVAA
ncbi:MAG: NADP-dependent oxidoreductase [Sinobacteraceae bacterium]|nr:NADP-dependent oxidoreductase [Nevskiaceae bacterium]